MNMRVGHCIHISQAIVPVIEELFWQWQYEHKNIDVEH